MTDQELVGLAAEKIMGWKVYTTERKKETWARRPNGDRVLLHFADQQLCWHPLNDWRAAGEIVEKMRADGCRFYVSEKVLRFGLYGSPHHNGDFPRAITIAALLVCNLVTEADLS